MRSEQLRLIHAFTSTTSHFFIFYSSLLLLFLHPRTVSLPSSTLNYLFLILNVLCFFFAVSFFPYWPLLLLPLYLLFTSLFVPSLYHADDHSDSHSSHGYGQMDSNSTHGAGHGTGLGVGYSPTPSSPLPLPLSGFGPTVASGIPRVKLEVKNKN